MKHSLLVYALALALPISACNNESEEAPDITEAIPLDEETEAEGAEVGDSADAANGTASDGVDSSDNSGAATMERGGPDTARPVDPNRSKLQKADPAS